jgi:V/A-type H+-transporting ATPase subunit E
MQNKLQELTDKLYNEGLSKGKQEADELLAKAKEEAAAIIAAAKVEAEQIIAGASNEAEQLKSKAVSDLRMASNQTIAVVKQQVESVISTKVVAPQVKDSLQNAAFVSDMIKAVVKSFNATDSGSVSLDVALPASLKSTLGAEVEKAITKELNDGVTISYTKGISGGFKVAPKDGGYFISFAQGDFESLLCEYLRPVTRKVLFGE